MFFIFKAYFMLISWIKKTTLLDYPGKIACIIFTTWCNLRCKYCHNSEFVLPEKIAEINSFIPENIFFNFLKTKIWLLDAVVICWWEPTIHKDLEEFCKKIKELWFLVKLDTNGQNPHILKTLLKKNLVDYIAMDIKWDFDTLENLVGVPFIKKDYLDSIQLILNATIDYEFRTTLIKNYHSLENFEKCAQLLHGAKKYFLQNYKGWDTLIPDFNGESFSQEELLNFKKIWEKYVQNCKIRE